jgi:hypothetical protein
MLYHPEILLAQVRDHQRELLADADQSRLRAATRHRRRKHSADDADTNAGLGR